MNSNKTYINWSSGKDAMLALHQLGENPKYSIEKLVTTINTEFNRVSMHGLHASLLKAQAKSLDIPLHTISFQGNISLTDYNATMKRETLQLQSEEFTHSVFGDIFLEDLKTYREQQLNKVGLKPVFPLWKKDTRTLVEKFIQLGYKAIVVCINAKALDKSFCGRLIDEGFLYDLPPNVDPCGENGEFHTFVFDGPLFSKPVNFEVGEQVLRDYSPSKNDNDCFTEEQSWNHKFWYVDLKLK